EQTKLGEAEKRLRLELQAQQTAELAKQRQIVETAVKAEAAKQIAAATADRDRLAEGLKLAQAREAEVRRQAREEADKRSAQLKAERDQMAERLRQADAREAT